MRYMKIATVLIMIMGATNLIKAQIPEVIIFGTGFDSAYVQVFIEEDLFFEDTLTENYSTGISGEVRMPEQKSARITVFVNGSEAMVLLIEENVMRKHTGLVIEMYGPPGGWDYFNYYIDRLKNISFI